MPRRSAKPRRLPNTQRIGASRANAGEGKKSSCPSHLCETPQPCGEPTRPLAPRSTCRTVSGGVVSSCRERAKIVAELLATLEPDLPSEGRSEGEWIQEIERRARAAIAGSPGVSWAEARNQIQSRLSTQ